MSSGSDRHAPQDEILRAVGGIRGDSVLYLLSGSARLSYCYSPPLRQTTLCVD